MTNIELFQKLLRFKSITPSDGGSFEFIKEYLANDWKYIELNIKDVKNIFFYKKFNDKKEHLCFAGHLDVVPAGEGWSVDPFDANIKDGVIIARGAQDMKSGVASFLYACKHTKSFDGVLSILLTSDEEGDAINGTVKVLEYLKKIDFLPTSAIVAEPTCEKVFGDAIKVGRRGSINGYLEIKGKQGHAAYPEKARNPIHQISKVLNNIAGYTLDDGDEYFASSQLIITDIRSGMEVTNVTPNKLKMMFNVRNSTKTTQKDIKEFIDKNCKEFDYTLKLTQGSYPFMTNINAKVIQKMRKCIKNILGVNTKNSTAGGTSDARFFGQFKIDTIEFGVINDTIHSIDEKTTIKQIDDLTNIFIDLINNY